jgi:hypothetical protein
MKLVRLKNYQLVVEDELLLLSPFKKLYTKDKSKDKQKFIEFLTIVYFVYDPRSDYSYIINEDERIKEVCTSNGFTQPVFSALETECIELYKKLTTTVTQELLSSTKIAIGKIRDFLEQVDLTLTDTNGKPIYTINSITSAIKQIPQLAKDVMEAEKVVAKELEEQGRARGGNQKTLMDDGILI